jgi:hypothetical protein
MIAVITGDIINSSHKDPKEWLKALKQVLTKHGETPKTWEIYRGDSFQLSVIPKDALLVTLQIKSAIKQIEDLDVRLGIGLGEIDFESLKITESNGSAFVRSGESFEYLKKQNIMFKSADPDLNEAINTMLGLSLYISNKWSTTVSEIIKLAIENPNLKQIELADQLGKSQSNISEALKRGGFDEIMAMNTYYKKQILKLC